MTVEQLIAEIRRLPAPDRARLKRELESALEVDDAPSPSLPNALEPDSIFGKLVAASRSTAGDVADRHDWYLGEAALGNREP